MCVFVKEFSKNMNCKKQKAGQKTQFKYISKIHSQKIRLHKKKLSKNIKRRRP